MAVAVIPQTTWFSGGINAAGGSLYVYQTGTTTLVTIYSDGALTTPITNPIVLDANGNASFYVGTSVNLKLQAYTSAGVLIETLDPVYPISTSTTGYLQKATQSTGTTYTLSPADVSSGTLFYPTAGASAFTYTIPQSALTSNIGYFGFYNQANTGGITLTFSGGATVKAYGNLNGVTSISMNGSSVNGAPAIIFFSDGSGNVDVVYVTPDIQQAISQGLPPQGRLSLSSSAPVLTSDTTASNLFYVGMYGSFIPVWNGTQFNYFNGAGISLALNATNHPATQVFDVYASLVSGTLTLSAMYWGSNTSRSTSAAGKTGTGNASITQKNGIWVNNAAISSNDAFNGNSGVAVSQNQGTLLGSFYTTGNGQTAVNIKPAAASGGGNNVVGVFNAYNRVKLSSISRDSNNWTYATASWRSLDGNNNNRVTWLDGLQQISVRGTINNYMTAASPNYALGLNLDSTSASPSSFSQLILSGGAITDSESFLPQLGLHFLQGMEIANAGTTQTLNATASSAYIILDTEY